MHIAVLHTAVACNLWPALPELVIAVTDTKAVFAQVVSELVESARNNDYTDVIMIHEHRGEPDGLVVCHLPYGPSAYFGIFNTVLNPLACTGHRAMCMCHVHKAAMQTRSDGVLTHTHDYTVQCNVVLASVLLTTLNTDQAGKSCLVPMLVERG